MKYFNNSQDETFTEKQTKRFLKVIKNQKYECYFKLIMTYQLSRMELISLEWKDIDFENNTISICPVSYVRNTKFYYSWNIQKLTENKRTMPLLPSIKKLLLKLKQEQVENSINIKNYFLENKKFVCLKQNGTRINYNTLSRNIRYIARDNNLPQILTSGLKMSLDSIICKLSKCYDFYRAWTRFDCKTKNKKNVYNNFNLNNKQFIKALNNILDNQTTMEM